jgi:TonB family protein
MRGAAVSLWMATVLLGGAAADTPPEGFQQMVDSPLLKAAFAKAAVGEVELAVDVGADGSIANPRILRSVPPGIFDAAALAMLAGRHLPPAIRNGMPAPDRDRRLVLRFQAEADPPAVLEPAPVGSNRVDR